MRQIFYYLSIYLMKIIIYIWYIFIYGLMASNWWRKEAEGTPQQQLPTPTTPMT